MQLTSSQKRGLLALFVILAVLAGIRLRSVYLANKPNIPKQKVEGDSSRALQDKIDLNAATEADLEKLPGIGQVLAVRIVKYRNAIGGFDSVDQLQKVYGLKPETFELIKPHVFVGEGNRPKPFAGKSEPDDNDSPGATGNPEFHKYLERFRPGDSSKFLMQGPKFYKVDVNTADSVGLVKVPGIGALTASRILALRKALGFFLSVDQVRETRGISDENFEKMKSHLFVADDLSAFPKLAINKATFAELRVNPYIGYKSAQLIISYRDEHGPYKSLADLKKIYGIDGKTWIKLEPYLEF